jgi:octanoyl-[GcvH]:protein N-octanoyltransferase
MESPENPIPEHGILASVQLFDASFPDPPVLDTAVSHALLLQVARGHPASLRLHVPGSVVAFGRRDVVQPGYAAACEAAERAGFAAVERLAGGRAAVFHQGTLAFSMALPVNDPRAGITERFQLISAIMCDAFRALGADARIGEVPGEYCPGSYSVNLGGSRKVMGVGQRIISGAAHIGGVVVVAGGTTIADVLIPVYEALDIEWDPSTSGDLSGTGASIEQVRDAIQDQFERRFDLVPSSVSDATLELAASLLDAHHPSVSG